MDKSYIGACGNYCGSCPIMTAQKKGIEYQKKLSSSLSSQMGKTISINDIQCPGCKDSIKDRHSWAFRCNLRKCASSKGHENCSSCEELKTCKRIKDMSDLYSGTLLKQLDEYKNLGADKWYSLMEKRWTCQDCGEAIDAATKKCICCNSDNSKHVNKTFEKQNEKTDSETI